MSFQEPYPGLRSFRKDESDIFFGRDEHVDTMIDKLADAHFLCITGPSGCGKSSLARTGLLNGLEAGFLKGTGSDWIFCDFRPGGDPLEQLKRSLVSGILENHKEQIYETEDLYAEEIYYHLDNHVAKRSHNLADALRTVKAVDERPVLILVDQFEELFRYAQSDPDAAANFVSILLQSIQRKENVYVVITIRTDELEKCSLYSGLTRLINESQFLTPVPNRYQIQEAIEGPITLFGGSIEPQFSLWLLNSLDEELDKLPLMQHALKLIYSRKSKAKNRTDITLDIEDFRAVFQLGEEIDFSVNESRFALRNSLSNRLDQIFDELPKYLKPGAANMLCALTSIESRGRDIRRPLTISELAGTIGNTIDDTRKIIFHFNSHGEYYLHTTNREKLHGGDIVDINHECILRLWKKIQNEWLVEEQKSSDNLLFLAKAVKNFQDGITERGFVFKFLGAEYLRGFALDQYESWFKTKKPTKVWARRYLESLQWAGSNNGAGEEVAQPDEIFEQIDTFLAESRTARTTRTGLITVLIVFLITAPIVLTYNQLQLRSANEQIALARADAERIVADSQRERAITLGRAKRDTEIRYVRDRVGINARVESLVPGQGDPVLNVENSFKTFSDAIEWNVDADLIRGAFSNLWRSLSNVNELHLYSHGSGDMAQVRAADFYNDGETFLTLTKGGILSRWEINNAESPIMKMDIRPEKVYDTAPDGRTLKISPTGNIAIAGFRDGALLTIDPIKQKVAPLLISGARPHSDSVLDIAFSSDGTQLVTSSYGGNIVVWSNIELPPNEDVAAHLRWSKRFEIDWVEIYANSQLYQEVDRSEDKPYRASEIWSVDISPDKQQIAFGLGNGRVCIIQNRPDGLMACSTKGHLRGKRVKSLKFHPKLPLLVSAGDDDRVVYWAISDDPNSREMLELTGFSIAENGDIWDLDFSVDGSLLATASWDGNVRIYESDTGRVAATLAGHKAALRTVRFSRSTRLSPPLLLTASIDRTARVWSPYLAWTDDRELSYQVPFAGIIDKPRVLSSVRFGPGGKWLAFTDQTDVWIKSRGEKPKALISDNDPLRTSNDGGSISQIAVHPRGEIVVASHLENRISLWKKTSSGSWKLKSIDLPGIAIGIQRAIDFSPSGSVIAVAVQTKVDSIILLCPFDQVDSTYNCSENSGLEWKRIPFEAFAADGACRKGKKHWPLSVDFSDDGKKLAVGGSDCVLHVYHLLSDKIESDNYPGHVGIIYAAEFAPDGKSIVTASADWTARLWSLESGKAINIGKHKAGVRRAVFSPSGLRVISASSDGIARIWDVSGSGSPHELFASRNRGGGLRGLDVMRGRDHTLIVASTDKGSIRTFRSFDGVDDISEFAIGKLGHTVNAN